LRWRDKTLDICGQCETPTWCWPTDQCPICEVCRVQNFYDYVLYEPLGIQLPDFVRQELRAIFGPTDVETGARRIRQVYQEWPKKNGKSMWVAGLPLYHLAVQGDEVDHPRAFGAAAAKGQAKIVFEHAARYVRNSSELRLLLKPLSSSLRIIRRDGHGTYEVISADGDLHDGVEPSLVVMDELHRWKTKKAETLYTVLTSGNIARAEPLTVQITTAGDVYDSPICWRQHERARRHIEGTERNPRFHAQMFGVNEKRLREQPDYWMTREARAEANPSHEDRGGFLLDSAIVEKLDEIGEQAYKRLHLNIWAEKAERWMPMDAWLRCGGSLRPLMDRQCYLGLDLSSTTAMCGLAAVFPDDDGSLDILCAAFMPENRVSPTVRRTHVDLPAWVRSGHLILTPGDVVDYNVVRKTIEQWTSLFSVVEICYDPWNATHFMTELTDAGYTCIKIQQNAGNLSAAMKYLLEKVLAGQVRHDNNPVLNWHADSVVARSDSSGNIKPDKSRLDRDGKMIDLVSATVTALAHIVRRGTPVMSVYDDPKTAIV
jgi:phage terminase large subunit-like protein